MIRIDPDKLELFCQAALTFAGTSSEAAEETARGLVFADLHGFDTHGVANLERVYLAKLSSGQVNGRAVPTIVLNHGAIALVNASNGLGYPAAVMAMDLAIEKAGKWGIGAVGVRNSTHCGSMSYYTRRAISQGMLGFAFTNLGSQSVLRPPNGKRPLVGTNVLAMAAPAGGRYPFDIDMSTAVVSTGHVRAAQRKGQPVPPGWLADEDGNPVTDPQAFLDGSAFLQFLGGGTVTGGFKGYGLALMADILCGPLTGAAVGANRTNLGAEQALDSREDQDIGHFFIAINAGAFRPDGDFLTAMDEMLGCLVECPSSPGAAVGYPGQLTRATAQERRDIGIPMDPPLFESLERLANRIGIKPLRPLSV